MVHSFPTRRSSDLVVGDREALKVHVHTDDPGRALAIGTATGVIDGVEIANMHEQTVQREERLLEAVPDARPSRSAVVAVVAGDGNRALFESLGATNIVEGGQTMNPSTAELVDAVAGADADEVILLPNNSNVILSADQAAGLAEKPVTVVFASAGELLRIVPVSGTGTSYSACQVTSASAS